MDGAAERHMLCTGAMELAEPQGKQTSGRFREAGQNHVWILMDCRAYAGFQG